MDARRFVPQLCCNPTSVALECSVIGQLFQRLHFRNHVFEWRLVGRPVQSPLPQNLVLPIVVGWAYYPFRVRSRACPLYPRQNTRRSWNFLNSKRPRSARRPGVLFW